MIVRCWGARGSVPVSGKEYNTYGGDTCCIEVRTKDDEIIIIDAGSGIRRLGCRLIDEKQHRFTMFFTHAHWDHIMGFPFFKPLYSRKTHITMLESPLTQASAKQIVSKIMHPPYFPVHSNAIGATIDYHDMGDQLFHIHGMTITPIALSHPNGGVGYKFTEDGKTFVFLTDNELRFKHKGGLDYLDYVHFSMGADLLIHDAEYREEDYVMTKSWGHSLYKDALQLAMDAGVGKLGLFHHNQERTDQGVDEIVEDCRKTIAERQVSLDCFALYQGMEMDL
jgi:phosphoribosyl 1,2-cyclic phosphodiesterase